MAKRELEKGGGGTGHRSDKDQKGGGREGAWQKVLHDIYPPSLSLSASVRPSVSKRTRRNEPLRIRFSSLWVPSPLSVRPSVRPSHPFAIRKERQRERKGVSKYRGRRPMPTAAGDRGGGGGGIATASQDP